jgi:hypothetical protein
MNGMESNGASEKMSAPSRSGITITSTKKVNILDRKFVASRKQQFPDSELTDFGLAFGNRESIGIGYAVTKEVLQCSVVPPR